MQSRVNTHHTGMGLAQKPITGIDDNQLPEKQLIETVTVTVAVVGSLLMLLFVAIACVCCYKRRHTQRYNGYSSYTDSRRDTYPLEDLLSKPSLADPESVFSEASFHGHMSLHTNSWLGISGEDSSGAPDGGSGNGPSIDEKDPVPPYASSKVNNSEKMSQSSSTPKHWNSQSQRITKAAKIQEANEQMRRYSASMETSKQSNSKQSEGKKSSDNIQVLESSKSPNQRTSDTISEGEEANCKFYLSPSTLKLHRDSVTPGANSFLAATRCSFSHEAGHIAYGNKVPRTSLPRTEESEDGENKSHQDNPVDVVEETAKATTQSETEKTQASHSGTITANGSSHNEGAGITEDLVNSQIPVVANHGTPDPSCAVDTNSGVSSDAIVSLRGDVPSVNNTSITGNVSSRSNTRLQTNTTRNSTTQGDDRQHPVVMRRAYSCVQRNSTGDGKDGQSGKKTFSLNLQINFHFENDNNHDNDTSQSVPMVIHAPFKDFIKSVTGENTDGPQAKSHVVSVDLGKNEDNDDMCNNMKEKLLEQSFASKSKIFNSSKHLSRKRCSEPLVFENPLYDSFLTKLAVRRYSSQDTSQPQQPSVFNMNKFPGTRTKESMIKENHPYVTNARQNTDTSNSQNDKLSPQSEKKVENTAVLVTKATNFLKAEETNVSKQCTISEISAEGDLDEQVDVLKHNEPENDVTGLETDTVKRNSQGVSSETRNPHEDCTRPDTSVNIKQAASVSVIVNVGENENIDEQTTTVEDENRSTLKQEPQKDEVFSDTEEEPSVSLDNSFSRDDTSLVGLQQEVKDKRRSMSDGDLGVNNSFYLRLPSYGKYATINEGLNIPIAKKRTVEMRKPVPLPRTSKPGVTTPRKEEKHGKEIVEADAQSQNVDLCEKLVSVSQTDGEVKQMSGELSSAPPCHMPDEAQLSDSESQAVGRRVKRYQGPKRHGAFFDKKREENAEKSKDIVTKTGVGEDEGPIQLLKTQVHCMTHHGRRSPDVSERKENKEKRDSKEISPSLKGTNTVVADQDINHPSTKQEVTTDSCNNNIPLIYIEENTKSGSSGEDEADSCEKLSGESLESRTRKSEERPTRRVISYDSYHDGCVDNNLEAKANKLLDESDESDYDNPWDDLDSAVQRASMRYNRRPSRIAAGDTKTWLKSAEDLGRLMEEAEKRRQLRQTVTKSSCQVTSPTSPNENLTIPFTRFSPHRHTVKGIVALPQLTSSQSSEDILQNPKLSLLKSAEIASQNKKAIDSHRPKSLSSRVKAKISSPEMKKRKK